MPNSRETEPTMNFEKMGVWMFVQLLDFFEFVVYLLLFTTGVWLAWNFHISELFNTPKINYQQAWFVVMYSKVAYDILQIRVIR